MTNLLEKYLPWICAAMLATPFILNFLGAPTSMAMAVEFLLFGSILVLRSLVTRNFFALAGAAIATVGTILFIQQWGPLQTSMGAVIGGGVFLSLGIALDERTTKVMANEHQ
jgi:hypothetical protein